MRTQGDSGPGGGPQGDMGPLLQQLDLQLEASQAQYETAHQRFQRLESELREGRLDITLLDEQFDELLDE